MTTNPDTFDHMNAPLRIGRVRLKVRDLEQVAGFYEKTLGLTRRDESGGRVTLGTRSTPLLELEGDPTLAPGKRRDAGLFHTAFLLPSRADLGRWLGFAIANEIPLQGASDHIVSEAVYLADPEGNGIEIYADRAPSHWRDAKGDIHMATEAMDAQGVLNSAAGTQWSGFPEDGFIGHVHLQVGDTKAATHFYRNTLGFDLASDYPGAAFFGSGGYHHHLAGNIWNSRGAGARPEGAAGLASVELISRDAATRSALIARIREAGLALDDDGATVNDPWGTRIILAA